MKVNRTLLPMKAQYFLFNAGLAGIVSFLTIYARQLGFSGTVVGTIYTVLPITAMLAKPIFGAVADYFQLQKSLFLTCQVVMMLSYFVVHFIPEIPSDVILDCDVLTYLKACSDDIDSCVIKDVMSDNSTVQCQVTCDLTDNSLLRNEVCDTWYMDEYCHTPVSTLQFEADVPLDQLEHVESCFHFRVSNVRSHDIVSIPYCKNITKAVCTAQCNSAMVNQLLNQPVVANTNVAHYYQFWLFFLLLVVAFISKAAATTMGDAICFQLLDDKPQEFGKQRLWGAVGWGMFAILSGVLVDQLSVGKPEKDYTIVFYLLLVLMALNVAVSSRLECTQHILSSSIMRNVGKLLVDPRIIVFLVWCMFIGMTTGLLWQFLFWHLEDLIAQEDCNSGSRQWIKTLEGLAMGIRCFGGELPFFFIAGSILKKIGHVHAMSVVLFTFGLRCVLYSFLTNPWWCLPLELLQGVTFGIFYTTMASYASIVAPPGTEATVQGVVGAVFEGVGLSLGSLLGGVLYDIHGGAVTFQVFGIACFVMFVLHIVVQYFLDRSSYYRVSAEVYYTSPQAAKNILDDGMQSVQLGMEKTGS